MPRDVRLEDLDADPYPILDRLRESEPVAWIPKAEMWFVTRYNDCTEVLRDSGTFTTDFPRSTIRETFGPQMLSADGPDHRRFRAPCNALFRPRDVQARFGAAIRGCVDRLIDAFAHTGTCELRAAFAGPLAVETVAVTIGLPPEDAPRIRAWYDDFAGALANFQGDDTVRARGAASAEAFRRYARPHLERARRDRPDSLFAALASAGNLAETEILSNAMIVMFGGVETTESMILNAVWAILTHPQAYDRIRRDPPLLRRALDESLRWDPAVQTCTRHATRDTQIRGVTIRAGDTVQCMLGAANRDPRVFTNPGEFDLDRANAADHLTFGYGRHLCIGKHLGLLEAETGIGEMLRRLPDLEIDPDATIPPRGHEFRKPPRLTVRWRT